MLVAVGGPDVLRVLPRILDELRRMSFAVAEVRAMPASGRLQFELAHGDNPPSAIHTLVARISGMQGVTSVAVEPRAARANIEMVAVSNWRQAPGRSIDG